MISQVIVLWKTTRCWKRNSRRRRSCRAFNLSQWTCCCARYLGRQAKKGSCWHLGDWYIIPHDKNKEKHETTKYRWSIHIYSILICTDNLSFSYMFFLVPQFGKSSTTLCRFIVAYINPHFCFFTPLFVSQCPVSCVFFFFMTYWNRRWESMGFQPILQVINLFPWSVGVVSSGTFGFVQQ